MDPRRLPTYDYPRAGTRGNPELARIVENVAGDMASMGLPPAAIGPTLVQGYIRFYRHLPKDAPGIDKSQIPALYALLGSGTPPLKMSREDSAYQDRPVGQQRCGNCSSAYQNLVTGELICSQIEGEIEESGWCRIWNSDRF